MTAKTLMIQGTASHAGKSVLTAAFCRLFARAGYRVAPFKAQNMSNNSFVTRAGGEIGRAQAFQAQAAGVEPHVDMNPILLKPDADTRAQVVVFGQAVDRMSVHEYHDYQRIGWQAVTEALQRLQAEYDLIIIEGAGSPAEVNLRDRDIVNMKVARYLQAPVLLAADIERGGVFASMYGTWALLTEEEQDLLKGFLINKFRGDATLLDSGLEFIEEKTGVPVLAVLPYVFGLPVDEEDSVSIRRTPSRTGRGILDIAIIHLPHISNATDFDALSQEPDVSIRFIETAVEFGAPDVVIIPGTKSTVADFEWMTMQGLDKAVLEHCANSGWVIGICGGYQILGGEIRDPDHVEGRMHTTGLGVLPVTTHFQPRKALARVEGQCRIPGLEGARIRGYEIHQGRTELESDFSPAFQLTRRFDEPLTDVSDGVAYGPQMFGTYVHGLFDHAEFRRGYLNILRETKGLEALPVHAYDTQTKDFDQLADWLLDHVDIHRLCELCDLPVPVQG